MAYDDYLLEPAMRTLMAENELQRAVAEAKLYEKPMSQTPPEGYTAAVSPGWIKVIEVADRLGGAPWMAR